jgi:hypothetical protein
MVPMIIRSGSMLAALTIAAAPLSSTAVAAPTRVNVDEFQVTLGGTTVFDDSFASNTELVGGAGALQPASVTFAGGGTANYFVHGSIPQTTANGGQATLDTANGTLQSQPPPFISTISTVGAFLQTGTMAPHSLTPARAFTVSGLFDVSVPTAPLGTYNIVLTNRTQANSQMGNVLELRVQTLRHQPVRSAGLRLAAHNAPHPEGLPGTCLSQRWRRKLDYLQHGRR